MIQDYSGSSIEKGDYCLLGVIVNRGKGEKVLKFARKMGFTRANCLLAEGKSSHASSLLELLALDETHKEIVLLKLNKEQEEIMLHRFNEKFHFDRPYKGIAFTIPMCHPGDDTTNESDVPYAGVVTILNENLTDEFSDFVQKNGYPGLTTIKARGAASVVHPLMERKVESAKSIIFMIVHRNKVDKLIKLVTGRFDLASENTGILVVNPISRVVGLTRVEGIDESFFPSASFTALKKMVIALVPNACAEDYLHKISKLGVSGSTIVHSRFANLSAEAERLLPFIADREEEMVITLAGDALAQEIYQHISSLTFENQIEKLQVISLPVIQTKGVREERGADERI